MFSNSEKPTFINILLSASYILFVISVVLLFIGKSDIYIIILLSSLINGINSAFKVYSIHKKDNKISFYYLFSTLVFILSTVFSFIVLYK